MLRFCRILGFCTGLLSIFAAYLVLAAIAVLPAVAAVKYLFFS